MSNRKELRLFTVWQEGEWNGERSHYRYRYAVEAGSAEEAVEWVTGDTEDILTEDFVNAPNGLAWVGYGYAEEVANA